MTTDQGKLIPRLLDVIRSLNSEAELETSLGVLFSAAADLTNSEQASLLEYDEASINFRYKFVLWRQRESQENNVRIPLNGSLAGWAFLNGAPMMTEDAAQDPRHSKKVDEFAGVTIHSLLAVPVFSNGKLVGVLEVFNKAGRYLDEDVQILEMLAALTGAALYKEALLKNILASQEEARELDRLKNEFIAITSHELRTPLGLILGHSTFLKELLDDKHEEQVDSIIRNASRLKEIIESLTSVDNYETGGALVSSRKVSVARIIEDVSMSFAQMAEAKNITIKKVIPPGRDIWVEVDSAKVSIILGNLIKNAITFTNNGGEIVIRAEQHPDYVKVTIKDNGIGIPAKDLTRIFERFYQVESHLTRRHGGMGLGLSVAKVMVEMHGGRIWVDSEEGNGSMFSFILPVRSEVVPPASAPAFTE